MKRLLLFAAVVTVLSMPAFAFAGDVDQPMRLGFGLGIPYGGLGLNAQFRATEMLAMTAGAGTMGVTSGYAIGPRFYIPTNNDRINLRMGLLYGVMGYYEIIVIGGPDFDGPIKGTALSFGFDTPPRGSNWNFDFDLLLILSDDTPDIGGAEDLGSPLKISFGAGYNF